MKLMNDLLAPAYLVELQFKADEDLVYPEGNLKYKYLGFGLTETLLYKDTRLFYRVAFDSDGKRFLGLLDRLTLPIVLVSIALYLLPAGTINWYEPLLLIAFFFFLIGFTKLFIRIRVSLRVQLMRLRFEEL